MGLFTINKHYNFAVFANSILGTFYTNARLVSILDYSTAIKFDNIELKNKQVYPYLPPGTLEDHTKYTYYLFKHRGNHYVIADVWIDNTSVEETEGLNYTIKLNNIPSTSLAVITNQLRLLGISFDIVE